MDPLSDPRIMLAAFVVQLGITTVEKVREVFASDGHDDATLAAIMTEVDRRIARRS